jgi:hypothetical protein
VLSDVIELFSMDDFLEHLRIIADGNDGDVVPGIAGFDLRLWRPFRGAAGRDYPPKTFCDARGGRSYRMIRIHGQIHRPKDQSRTRP